MFQTTIQYLYAQKSPWASSWTMLIYWRYSRKTLLERVMWDCKLGLRPRWLQRVCQYHSISFNINLTSQCHCDCVNMSQRPKAVIFSACDTRGSPTRCFWGKPLQPLRSIRIYTLLCSPWSPWVRVKVVNKKRNTAVVHHRRSLLRTASQSRLM